MSHFFLLLSFTFCVTISSQNRQLLFGVNDLPQSLLLNPGAEVSFNKHIGIPFLSGLHVNAGSSGLNIDDLFREGTDFNTNIRNTVFRLTDRDFFTINQQLDLLSFGWKSRFKDVYYSAGLYQEFDFILYFPRDIAVLALDGNANAIGTPFELSDISATAELLSVYHFGISKKVTNKLRLGARTKLYSSIANINSARNDGVFITTDTPQGPNFLSHDIIGANVRINTSGLRSLSEGNASGIGIASKALFSPNFGLGLDVGGTYSLTDKITLTGSILDLGFIVHNSDLLNFGIDGDFTFQGLDLDFSQATNEEETGDNLEQFINEFERELNFEDDASDPFLTLRPVKLNAAINYSFSLFDTAINCDCVSPDTNYNSNTGIQLFAIQRPRGPQAAITAYFDHQWASFIRTKISYTIDPFSASNLGLLVSTKINKFNLYLAADNLLDYGNLALANNASLQMGLQLVFNEN